MAKLKQFVLTRYYKSIELYVICVTTSAKKFAELVGCSPNEVKVYAHSYEPRDKECIANPDILYAKAGLGGEVRYFTTSDLVLPYTEYQALIDKHRETYDNYRDYLKKTGQE